MNIIVEDGSRPAGANSYVDPAGAVATAYFEGHLRPTAWTAATTGMRETAVAQATRILDTMVDWKGVVVDSDQELAWPRAGIVRPDKTVQPLDAVPKAIAHATLELALALLTSDRTTDTAQTAPVTKLGVGKGAVELEFGADPTKNLPVIPDIVAAMLRPWGTRRGRAGMVAVFRG